MKPPATTAVTGPCFVFPLFASLALSCLSVSGLLARTIRVNPKQDLQTAIHRAKSGDTLRLSAGVFRSQPIAFTDSLCGNCETPQTLVKASWGFSVDGKSLTIIGAGQDRTILNTRAGYGIWVVNSANCYISALTVTGGWRDADGNATNAGIVARHSQLTIERVTIRDNKRTDTSVVVGIGGIFGREGAELTIRHCDLLNNTWDGVALYRGASAVISDCRIINGRGAGIGVTWDATAIAVRNEVTGYWKGIGSFGTSWVSAQNNLVHHNLGWGIVCSGESFLDASNNVVFANGNCGMAVWGTGGRGRMVNNIIVNNGWRKQWVCPCVGVWNNGDWAKWDFSHNIVWNNVDGQYRDIWDQTDINGNIKSDPIFADTLTFRLAPDSPARDAGSEQVSDPDGSRSDIGVFGGPRSK